MSTLEENARDYLRNPISSYRRLAQHLNNSNPRTGGDWKRLESELLAIAKLPPKPRALRILEDEV